MLNFDPGSICIKYVDQGETNNSEGGPYICKFWVAKCFKYKDQGKRLMGAEFFVIMVMDVPATGQMKYFHEGHAPFVHWLGHDLIVSSKLSSAYIKAILLCLENLCTVLMHTSHF